jgi:hypothetical protein
MRRTVSLDELDHFEQDDKGQLYWKGKRIVVEQRLIISWWVNAAIIATGLASVASAAVSALAYFHPAVPLR